MRTSIQTAPAFLFVASMAFAQQATFDGKWTGRMVSSTGAPIAVDLAVAGKGGTLRLVPSGYSYNNENTDQCHQRDIPVEVESRTESTLSFVVRGDAALQGCFKGAGMLTLVNAKSLDGTLKDGRSFKLVRK